MNSSNSNRSVNANSEQDNSSVDGAAGVRAREVGLIEDDLSVLCGISLTSRSENNGSESKKCEPVSMESLSIKDIASNQSSNSFVNQKIDLKHHDVRKKLSSASDIGDVTKVLKVTPRVNCTEKIVLCIDVSSELEEMVFQLGDGRKFSSFYMVKRVLEIFINTKHRIDKQHEFALVMLNKSAVMLKNFTNDTQELCSILEDLHETQTCDSCELMSLFNSLYENMVLPEMADPAILPPPYVVRCILIYGRSNCIPIVDIESESLKKLQSSLYFFFDVLYIHQQPSNRNKCQDIFQTLCDIDHNYTSYIFEVSRNVTKLHNYMAMLLAHPLQRTPQNEACYKLKVDDEKTDD